MGMQDIAAARPAQAYSGGCLGGEALRSAYDASEVSANDPCSNLFVVTCDQEPR